MHPIPKKLREEMAADPFYRRCCITESMRGKIDWHHNLIFRGRQVQEKWAILPVNEEVHQNVSNPEIKQKLNWIMLNRATDEQLKKYSKAVDLIAERERLNKIYA